MTCMNGQQFGALLEALCDAFNLSDLDMLLRIRLEKSREKLVGSGDLRTVAFKVIEIALQEGWVTDLIRAACDWVPKNAMLRKFAEENPGLTSQLGVLPEGDDLRITTTINMHPLPTVIYH